jgi:excisionase family DNA binding protein
MIRSARKRSAAKAVSRRKSIGQIGLVDDHQVGDFKHARLDRPHLVPQPQHADRELAISVVADDEMLTTQQAAELLNVSRQYVVRLADCGTLPAVKVGSHRRLRVSDVEAFKIKRDADRDTAVNRLAAISEDIGGYRLDR